MYDETPVRQIPDKSLEDQRQCELSRLVFLVLEVMDPVETLHAATRARDIQNEIVRRARLTWDDIAAGRDIKDYYGD